MLKLFDSIADFLKGTTRGRLLALQVPVLRLIHYRWLSMSWVARSSRRFGTRAIVTVGLGFSVYTVFLFLTSDLTPNAPKPSHDVILKTRFSGPVPSASIVILDVDERSLASLATDHGRWPWSRDVLADGLQRVADLGARAVLFNVLLSDPDKNNVDADAAMEFTAQMVRVAAFPMIRLARQNDQRSQLRVEQIPGARLEPETNPKRTIAGILPMFGAMLDRIGVANQLPDNDGIVRKYPLVWEEPEFTLPSIVGRTVEVGQGNREGTPALISLNWRNKKGRYTRVSFSDLLKRSPEDAGNTVFKDGFVVLGVSAPGLGQTKPTSVNSVEDDNEILATALDDALHGTYLRTLPASAALIINLSAIWVLVWMAAVGAQGGILNKAFALGQSGLGGITVLSASYTNYLIDLSDCMSVGLATFAAIKIVQSLDDSWSRAKPGFRKIARDKHYGSLVLLGYSSEDITKQELAKLQRELEAIVGMSRFVRIDDLFGGESFIKPACAGYRCLLTLPDEAQHVQIRQLIDQKPYANKVRIDCHVLEHDWNPDDVDFRKEVAPIVMANCSEVLGTA